MASIADTFNQQLATFKSQLRASLANLAKAQADVDAASYQIESAATALTNKLIDWQGRVSSQLPGNSNANMVMSYFVSYIPQYADSETRNMDQYLSIPGLQQFVNVVSGLPSDTIPPSDPFWSIIGGMPSDITTEVKNLSDGRIAIDTATNEFSAASNQENSLESSIQAWLTQSAAYASEIGSIPTLADLIAEAKAGDHPISSQVTSSSKNLIYLGLAILGILVLTKKRKAATA